MKPQLTRFLPLAFLIFLTFALLPSVSCCSKEIAL